jgi:hypothetical protein
MRFVGAAGAAVIWWTGAIGGTRGARTALHAYRGRIVEGAARDALLWVRQDAVIWWTGAIGGTRGARTALHAHRGRIV